MWELCINKRCRSLLLKALAASLALSAGVIRAQDLSTINRDYLRNFRVAADQRQRPLTILSFGNSMADSYRSIAFCLMNGFIARVGIAGFALNNYRNAFEINLTNGTEVVTHPDAFWFTYHYQLPPGGGLWWETQSSPGGVLSDRVGLFYVAHPGGGAFGLSISTNTDPWASVLTLDGYSPTPVGHYTNIDLPLNYHRLRVDGQSGTNIILGAQLLNSYSAGVQAAFTDQPGINLDSITNVPQSIRIPIFHALAPDLLIWHMKVGGNEATRQRLIENEQWWANAIPNCSVVYIGTPWLSLDTNSTWTIDQNTVVRGIAVKYHQTYMDCMTPAVSYNWLVAHGFMADVTHLNLQGSQYLATFAWNELGFFAIGASLSLSIRSTPGALTLQFPTSTGILYTLESSVDLTQWEPLITLPGTGGSFSTNFSATGPAQTFRLLLEPE